MIAFANGGILRVASRIAYSAGFRGGDRRTRLASRFMLASRLIVIVLIASFTIGYALFGSAHADDGPAQSSERDMPTASETQLEMFAWDFGRSDDKAYRGLPDNWKRFEGIGFPKYVDWAIVARDPSFEKSVQELDTTVIRWWDKYLKPRFSSLPPLPPSIADALVDRYLRIQLDGGQFKAQSPSIPASRMYQYRFSADIMTQGLRHDTAHAELVFLDDRGAELTRHATLRRGGTTPWTRLEVDLVRPPVGATAMMVRVVVARSDDGLEDIRGQIGFDNLRIQQYPQLQLTTDEARGIYSVGRPVAATVKIMGLPSGSSQIRFSLIDHSGRELSNKLTQVKHRKGVVETMDSEVTWTLRRLDPGFYRVAASIVGQEPSALSAETTFAVIDELVGGPPHGPFGWTLPRGAGPVPPRELATWLTQLGVAWVKYPCWLETNDNVGIEETAALLARLQDSGLQTVGMLGLPPESQVIKYDLRGRRDLVAGQLFRDVATWQPLLEPVMSRLTLKVRTWQLGNDRDHSFLGRPRLRDSISQISTGLQGFGQPIDVAISWPWLEEELGNEETSWQAICRSSDPPLSVAELDAFLSLGETRSRGAGAHTWLLVDPIAKSVYDRQSRVRDLVLRMATVRSHRVQAAFISDPHNAERGLLRPSGRPDELLLPWRTTARLIGNLRKTGSLQLQSRARNIVFAGEGRAVLMVWSAEPTVERMYLGDNVQMIDVWGKVTTLPVQSDSAEPGQNIPIGPVPIFIVGAEPALLAFRMSVELQPNQLDSLLGQIQPMSVKFTNPTKDSLVGSLRVVVPEAWSIDSPVRNWESLSGRSASETFDVVLGNTAKIGTYDVPLQFELETVPPKLITVHRQISVGPEGLEIKVVTRMLDNNELRVQIEMTNRSNKPQSYDCLLFPPPGRQYQRRFVSIGPGETIRRELFWQDADELVGKRMLLRAIEQDGTRVVNFPIDVQR